MRHLLAFCYLFFLMFSSPNTQAQESFTVKGRIIDTNTKAAIFGATVSVFGTQYGTSSDTNGNWSLMVSEGSQMLVVKYVGYRTDSLKIRLSRNRSGINFSLQPDTVEISSVQVKGKARSYNMTKMDPGQLKLAAEELTKVPSLLGSKDPLNSLRSLPGIQSVGEGTGYFYVRGGGADHNLIMLDKAIIYHPSHLVGLFSVVNPRVINSIDLYKGGIPANYGNRLASVIDIETKDASYSKMSGELSIGVIASRIALETPLIQDKLSLSLAYRRTHLDLLYPIFMPKSHPFHGSGYAFSDFNGKLSWKLNEKNIIRLSAYKGDDSFTLEDSEIVLSDQVSWGNRTMALSSENHLSDRVYFETNISYSGFGINFEQDYREYFVGLYSGLDNLKFTESMIVQASENHRFRLGVEHNSYIFKPYKINIKVGTENLNFGESIPYRARDLAGYFDYRGVIWNKLILQAGVRLVHFEHISPFRRFLLDNNGFPIDSVNIPKGEVLASYTMPEPRLSLSLQILENARLKMSLNQNYQTVHMVPLSTSTLPIDLWLPSTSIIEPQRSNSFSLGWFQDFPDKRIEFSFEGYYREMDKLVDFSEYQTIMGLVKNNMDQQMSFGKGISYGLELMIRKNSGKYTGWIGYTISKTRHTFEDINNGEPFAPRHDRLHDLNLFVSRKIGTKWDASIQFVYASGQPTTIPLSYYVLNGNVIQYYNDRNSIRLPAYHRFDVAFTKSIPKKKKKYSSSWTFSVYNLYNRLNPFFVYYDLSWDYENNFLISKGRKIGLLPIIPSLTWSLEF